MMRYTYKVPWEASLRNELLKPFPHEPSPEEIKTLKLRKMTNKRRNRNLWVQKLGEVIFNPSRTVAIRLWYPSDDDQRWRVEALEKGSPPRQFGIAYYEAKSQQAENEARDRVAIWWQEALRR